jgi:hypothetical protein
MDNTTPIAVPWYSSPVQKAQVVSAVTAAVALFPKAGALVGIKTPADIATWVEIIFGIATLVAPVVGSVWRARSTLQPLTLTQKKADIANAAPLVTTVDTGTISDPKPLPEKKP